jgi:hypothetical protein
MPDANPPRKLTPEEARTVTLSATKLVDPGELARMNFPPPGDGFGYCYNGWCYVSCNGNWYQLVDANGNQYTCAAGHGLYYNCGDSTFFATC